MQRLREWLTLALIGLLPLHALGVTVLTKLIAGPGRAPLPALAFWKEVLLLIVLGMAFVEIAVGWRRGSGVGGRAWKFDVLDCLILVLVALGLIVSFAHAPLPTPSLFLGIKYDLFPLVLFFVLRRADWSVAFKTKAMAVLLLVGALVSLYGILTFFLPIGFFTWLGYSDMHSLFLPDGPLAPFQLIGGSALHRIQSTMSGPNQLGIWLLLPLSVASLAAYRKRSAMNIAFFVLILAALVLTFSRAAWIGAFVILATLAYLGQSRLVRRKMFVWGAPVVLVALVIVASVFPSVILRSASTRGHLDKPLAGIRAMVDDPLGRGLGSAGPATNRTSDACVELEKGSDATWAQAHPDLCVFVGGEQVQPVGRTCNCPFVTENWYLQIGVELGVIGFVLFVAFVVLLLRALRRNQESLAPFLAFLGVCVCALFLHAFEDSAVAYTAFILAAVSLHPLKRFASS